MRLLKILLMGFFILGCAPKPSALWVVRDKTMMHGHWNLILEQRDKNNNLIATRITNTTEEDYNRTEIGETVQIQEVYVNQ